jgi:hypothetical protein
MSSGVPVPRTMLFSLKSGDVVVDWGNNRIQDIITGDFVSLEEGEDGQSVHDGELEIMKKNGQIINYDSRMVYIGPLPEPPLRTID